MLTCFLDIMSKAFERVNHSLLLDKLKDKGTPDVFCRAQRHFYVSCFVIRSLLCVNLFKSIFRDSEIHLIQVCYYNCMSDSWNIARGIRQGAVTSALQH